MGSSEHWNSALPNPTPCRDRQPDIITGSQIPVIPLNSATSMDSPSATQESDKQGTPGRATSDNPNITWMPVIKLIPKLAFEPCTDNEHSESWKTASLWSGRNVHRGEKEEMFYKFRQTLSISTVIQKLCPSWIDTIMHTKSNSIEHQSSHLNTGKYGSILENRTRNLVISPAFQYLLCRALFTVFSNSYSRCKKS